jgi:hypothetical protein
MYAGDFGGFMSAHDAGKTIAINDTQRFDPKLSGLGEQFFGRTRSTQETEL